MVVADVAERPATENSISPSMLKMRYLPPFETEVDIKSALFGLEGGLS